MFSPHFTLYMVIQMLSGHARAQIDLGTAAAFGVVASNAITNTGATIVTGDLGLFPNTQSSITGFPPGLSRTIYAGNEVAGQALQDAGAAYNAAGSLASTSQIAGADLGGQRLVAGTYTSMSSVLLTGTLTLDGQNNPDALFVFQIGSTLTTASSSSVVLLNGARACNVFFQVGSSATLDSSTRFEGNILALTSISLLDDASVNGGLYALNGAVTLINNQITPQPRCIASTTTNIPADPSPISPESSTDIPSVIQTTIQIDASSIATDGEVTIFIPSVTSAIPNQSLTPILPDQPNSSNVPDVPNIPITLTVPQVPRPTPIFDTLSTPIVPVVPTTSTKPVTSTTQIASTILTNPNVPNVSSSSGGFNEDSSTMPDTSIMTSSRQFFTSSRASVLTSTPTKSTRSSNRPTTSTGFTKTQSSRPRISSTTTTPIASISRSTTSTIKSRSNHSSKDSSFSTSTISTGGKSRYYSVYVSTRVWNSTYHASSNSKTYSRQTYETSEATKTSTELKKTTMINGTPCTTLSYYEPTCACTQTTVVPVDYTSGPPSEAADLVTVNGIPCTTTRYYEATCDCIRTSTVPIRAVKATASIYTVISGVPHITSKYFEPACDCVQTATVPVRIATTDEVLGSITQAACAEETNNPLFTCIAACMQPKAAGAVSPL